jgi:general secretion pathway protein H
MTKTSLAMLKNVSTKESTKYGSFLVPYMKGFTLIELMVVMLLLGLVSAVVLTTVGGGNQLREMQNEAKRLQAVLLMASDEAVFSNEEIGVMIEPDHYAFLRFNEQEGRWEDSEKHSLRLHTLPEWLNIDFQREGKERKILGGKSKKFGDGDSDYISDLGIMDGLEQGKKPNFMLLSSGEITGFTIGFQLNDDPDSRIEIKSTDQGDIIIPALQPEDDF